MTRVDRMYRCELGHYWTARGVQTTGGWQPQQRSETLCTRCTRSGTHVRGYDRPREQHPLDLEPLGAMGLPARPAINF